MLARTIPLLAILALLLTACGGETSSTPPATAADSADDPDAVTLTEAQLREVEVETIAVTERPVTRNLQLPARIRPEANQEAYATSLISGRVERLLAGVGDRVAKGEILAEIAAPNLGDLVADLRQARDELDRQRRLEERGVAITKNLNAARRHWEAARQRLRAIGISAERIERVAAGTEDMATLPLEAPMSGVVLDRMATLGAPVAEGEMLFHVADLQPIRVVADVFERDLGLVREGQSATVTTPTDRDREYRSTVAQIVPRVSEERRAALARLVLENADGTLKPGMYARVRIAVEGDVRPTLPGSALRSDERGAFVVVAVGSSAFRRIYVEADPSADGYVPVPELTPGTEVVTTGAFQIVSAMDAGG